MDFVQISLLNCLQMQEYQMLEEEVEVMPVS